MKRVFPETRRVARVRVHPNGNFRHFTSDAAEPKRFEQKNVFSAFGLNFRELVRAVLSVDFWQTLATAEKGTQKVGPFQGIPILGLDALGSASYGPEAALAVLMPLGVSGIHYVREVLAAIICLLVTLFFLIDKPLPLTQTEEVPIPSPKRTSASGLAYLQRQLCCLITF